MDTKIKKIKKLTSELQNEIMSLAETQVNKHTLVLLAGINILDLKLNEYEPNIKNDARLFLYTIWEQENLVKICLGKWQAHSADEAISEFLKFNPVYKNLKVFATLARE